jgi:hypothetical protein
MFMPSSLHPHITDQPAATDTGIRTAGAHVLVGKIVLGKGAVRAHHELAAHFGRQ